MTTCTHFKPERWEWRDVVVDPYGGTELQMVQVDGQSTDEDLDIGRFRCTQCGRIGYFTGLWRDFFEKGIPCLGSDQIKRTTMSNDHGAQDGSDQVDAAREEFEAWGNRELNYGFHIERDESGEGYTHDGTDTAWLAWQARAALASAPPAPDALDAARYRMGAHGNYKNEDGAELGMCWVTWINPGGAGSIGRVLWASDDEVDFAIKEST